MTDPAGPPSSASSPASAFARRSSSRTTLRRLRRAQTIAIAVCLLMTGMGWTQLVRLDWNTTLLVVPIFVAATAATAFIRRPWAAVLMRATLWGSFMCGASAAIGTDLAMKAVVVTVPAACGLLCLGRFSRSLGGARPLLVALIALAVSDAAMHSIAAIFTLSDGDTHESVSLVFAFAAFVNLVGLVCILRWKLVWPHVAGNAILAGLAATSLENVKDTVVVVVTGLALLQVALALALRLPPSPPRLRKGFEQALRLAVVLVTGTAIATALS